ncbi:hypothetical protein FRC11_014574, partial [Ceratobasidium sp. 423]
MLELVVPNLETGLEDLFPSIFGATIGRLWEALRGEEFVYNPLLVCIGLTLEHFKMMFKSLRENNATRPAVERLLEVLARDGLLDLIASVFFSLDPDAEEDTPTDSTNFNVLHSAQAMIEELALTAPPDLLGYHFQDYAMSWRKVYHQLDQLRTCVNDHQ